MAKIKKLPKLEQFQADLLQSTGEYKAGNFTHSAVVTPTSKLYNHEAAHICTHLGDDKH